MKTEMIPEDGAYTFVMSLATHVRVVVEWWESWGIFFGKHGSIRSCLYGDAIVGLLDRVRRHPGTDQYSNELDLLPNTQRYTQQQLKLRV